jgi:hypothetical protein
VELVQCIQSVVIPDSDPGFFSAPAFDHKTVTNWPSNSNSPRVYRGFSGKPYTRPAVVAVSRASSAAGRSTTSASARTV